MKKTILLAFTTMVFAAVANAQIWPVTNFPFANNYAFVENVISDGSDMTAIAVQVTVTGYTTSVPPGMGSAYHQFQGYVQIMGTNLPQQNGPQYCPNCNMNATVTMPFDLNGYCSPDDLFNGICLGTIGISIYCSVSNAHFNGGGGSSGFPNLQTEQAVTSTCTTSFTPPYPQGLWCSARSSPPDWSGVVSIYPETYPYSKAETICARWGLGSLTGKPWHCLGIGEIEAEVYGSPPDCTNYDKGFHPTFP